jgi:PPP family 3-phenylpropionic acid transporter
MPILLSIFYFFYFAIVGVYIIFIPKVHAMTGYSASDIGIIFAASPLIRFIMPFAFIRGLKIDRKIFNISLIVLLASALSFYFSLENFYALLLSNIGLGVGMSIILPFIEVISLSTMGKERYGKIRLFGSIGFVFVALVLVKYLNTANIALLFLLFAAVFTSIFAFIIVRNPQTKKKKEEVKKNDISLLLDWKLWLGLTLMQVSFGSFYNFFTIYETDFGISLDTTIYLWSFGVLAEIFMLFFQGKLLKNNLLLILQITTFASSLRWFLLYLYPQNIPLLYLSQSLHALSFALFHSAAISYLYFIYKDKALAQQFFSGITYGMGGFLGALIAGYIYEWYPRELFLSSTLFALLAFIFLLMQAKRIEYS